MNLPPYSEATCGICGREMRDNPSMHLATVRVEQYNADRDGEFDDWMDKNKMAFHQACVAKVFCQVAAMDKRGTEQLLTGRPT